MNSEARDYGLQTDWQSIAMLTMPLAIAVVSLDVSFSCRCLIMQGSALWQHKAAAQ